MATPQQVTNYVQTTLAAPMTNVATTATLTSVAGLPTIGNFRLRIDDVAPATTFEYVEVSSVNVGTGVVTFSGGAGVGRGLEGTTAIAHATGAIVGNDLTAAMLLLLVPLGVLGYAQATVDQGAITNVAVDLTSLAITLTPQANRRIKITFEVHAYSSVANDYCQLNLQEGATVLQQSYLVLSNVAGNQQVITGGMVISAPSVAAHTYKLTMLRAGGTGTLVMHAASNLIAYILAEDIGPV